MFTFGNSTPKAPDGIMGRTFARTPAIYLDHRVVLRGGNVARYCSKLHIGMSYCREIVTLYRGGDAQKVCPTVP